MTAAPFQLQLEPGDASLVDALVRDGAPRIGLDGLRAERGRRIWPAFVRGSAARHGFRWSLRDTFDGAWWPQGIDVAEHEGHRMLAVSWYARDHATRLSIVDLDRRRYHHVLLVEPVADAEGRVSASPVVVHAGGIAWLGDRILVADTFGGLREFPLADLLRLAEGHLVLPQSARYRARRADDRGMRFSFVSIEHADGAPRLVAGEYGNGSRTDRAARFTLDGEVELHEPGLYRMQGIVIVDGVWYVTTSNGEKTGGDLWVGRPGDFERHRHVLPAGPEDLAYDRRTGLLWSLSEWPGRRRVFQIDPRRLRRGVSSQP
ncbi:MAG: hypothetical protein ACTHKX_13340 [Pseudolysinimonas sp.]